MEKNNDEKSPPKIDNTWYFRGKLMENCYSLFNREYRWHKIYNCPRYKAKKSIKPCICAMPCAEDGTSSKYAIMGCSLEILSAKWPCLKCDHRIYFPPDCLESDLEE